MSIVLVIWFGPSIRVCTSSSFVTIVGSMPGCVTIITKSTPTDSTMLPWDPTIERVYMLCWESIWTRAKGVLARNLISEENRGVKGGTTELVAVETGAFLSSLYVLSTFYNEFKILS